MFKVIATDVVISKGYDGAPALKFSENGESVRFRIGKKVYDTRAENNTRWVNLSVKAFGPVCERIKKMQLKESSFINILGRLDEDVWEDSTTHEKRSAMVVILDEIEYCSSGGGKQKTDHYFFHANSFPKIGLQFHILLVLVRSGGGLWAGLTLFFKLLLGLNCR